MRDPADACRRDQAPCLGPYLIAFNLAGDRTLQYLFPRNAQIHPKFAGTSDAMSLDPGSPVLRTKVMPPFGTDMLVVVASPKPIPGLAVALAAMDQQIAPLDALAALKRLLPADAQLGTQSIFTGP